jgi:hypothetical protein
MTTEITTTSLLALFETDKSQRQDFAMRVVDALENGQVDPLKVHLQVKCMEDIIKQINANSIYKSRVLEAAQAYGEKTFQFNNAKIEIKETGVKYDFSKCEDPILDDLLAKQEALDKEVKSRQEMLKTVSEKGLIITDPGSGETFTVYPPAKSSTTNVAVTLK